MSKTPIHRVSDRLAAITPSATLAVDAKAKNLKASGVPVIGFAAGEPDFATPANIVEAARQALEIPANFKYTPAAGLLPLRKAIAERSGTFGDKPIEPSQVLVTNGGKQAVYQACAAIINAGDEVLLPAPYWTTYPECVKLAGGTPVPVVATLETDYKVTIEQLEAARTDKTIALIHCSPSNPTGAVYTKAETEAIAAWALEHGIWIISDEIYDHLVYGDADATSITQLVPEVADQTIRLNGVAKTYAMTGWRVGWMTGPADVIAAASSLQSHLSSNVNNIAQMAALEALTGPQDAVCQMRQAFDRRRQLIVGLLREINGFQVPMPQGAFYAFPDVTQLLGTQIAGKCPQNTLELADLILTDAEVAVVPGEAFGTPGYLRFSYAMADEDITEGIGRIKKLING